MYMRVNACTCMYVMFVHVCICKMSMYCTLCSKEWQTPDVPRVVLNKLEDMGYKVLGITGVGQTCVWTLHKPKDS